MKFFLLFLICSVTLLAEPFEKVVIWGHKLHTHTHSYIHNAFYKAFLYLGYETYWLDNSDDLSQYNLARTLFITEGQVDSKMPMRADSYYFLHNPRSLDRYQKLLDLGRVLFFQVYTDDVLERPYLIKKAPFHYYSLDYKTLYMPWATDLLPYEIEENKVRLLETQKESKVYWVGTVGSSNRKNVRSFAQACEENNISFIVKHRLSVEENRDLTMRSYMAPTIVGSWQAEKGYIPCRIFKNISYGQMGITNSKRAYQLFQKKIVYSRHPYKLFHLAEKRAKEQTLDEIFALMDFVKEHHTYLNRIEFMLEFLEKTI